MITINADRMRALVADIFSAAGCSRAEAERIGHYLVIANLTGHDSHGVQRVPRYLEWLRSGTVNADREVKVLKETPVLALVDAQRGFGQTVAPQAVDIGIRKAKAMGLSAVALRNAGHIGRVGDWGERAAEAGLVSVHFVNAAGSALVAPYGGVERRFSTAPYCVGVPRAGAAPLILDFATSIVAEGKVQNASFGGKPLPADALVDRDGSISADPHVLYGQYAPTALRDYTKGSGAIRAFGDHKGSGLAFMCEVLGGSLTGTGATEPGQVFANGMLSFYIDPQVIDPEGYFPADAAAFIARVKATRPIDPKADVLVPGEPEERLRREREANGLPLPENTWGAIAEAAIAVGLSKARVQEVTG